MSLYIASTLGNAQQVRRLRDRFAKLGIQLTYDWTEHNNGQPYVPDRESILKRQIAEQELTGILDAGCVLVVIPGGRGTHFEFGFAYMAQKPLVLLVDPPVPDDKQGWPSFYHLERIVKVHNEDNAVETVTHILKS